MFVRLESTPRDYAWGSTTAIAELLGREASGRPEAELWLGTHAGAPTHIVDPSQAGGCQTLAEWVIARPELEIGFLLKILAAAHPLSLQTHPTIAQARSGYAREEEAGVPLNSPERNFKDRNHKPELIVALSPTFDALCGFRPRVDVLNALRSLRPSAGREIGGGTSSTPAVDAFIVQLAVPDDDETAMAWALEWLLTGGPGVQELVEECGALAERGTSSEAVTVRELRAEYPGDPGIVVALLLNRVRLTRGEALFLSAGNVHAYLNGLGVELMASSDNVLRGGLTAKHVDVPELIAVTHCEPTKIPFLIPRDLSAGVTIYAPPIPDFALIHAQLEGSLNGGRAVIDVEGPALVICISGEITLAGQSSESSVRRGTFLFITPDEGRVQLDGSGEIFVAMRAKSANVDE